MSKEIDKTLEGWANDITGEQGKYAHYYKDGVSLCGKRYQRFFMTNFNKDRDFSEYSYDCSKCNKVLLRLKHEKQK